MTRRLFPLLLALLMLLTLAPVSQAEDLPYAKIDWYVGLNPLPDLPIVNDALNEYLMEKLNCEVNLIYMTSAEWEDKIGTMIASGQDMGILGFGSQSKSDYVIESQRGAYYPLNDLLETYGQETKALFDDAIWEAMKIGGNIYGIPSLKDNGYFISLIYNQEMADEFGIDIDSVKYSSFRDLEDLFREVKGLRDEKNPQWAERPIVWNVSRIYPYNFAFETFLNDSFLAVCNINGIMDIDGYDDGTVLNFYETPEFLDFALQKQSLVEEGIYAYDYEIIREWQYDGSIFAWVGWGYTFMQEHLISDAFTTSMKMSDRLWTETNNYFSAGTCISANCKNPEQAMQILNLVNTDPFMATMMRFGVEGVHYTYDAEGKMTFEGTTNADPAQRAYYYWYAAPVGNLTIVNAPEALTGPDGIMLTRMIEYNEACIVPRHMGFVFDTSPVVNELAACTSIVLEYQEELQRGQLNSQEDVEETVKEFVEKLKANGSEKIVAEVQRQIDAWEAAR